MALEPFKARIIEVALGAAAEDGFALAGGNALAAHGLLSRPTQDIDLFSPAPGGSGHVVEAVRHALEADGYAVDVLRQAEQGDFVQLQASRDGLTTQIDLGRDWRARAPVRLSVGPVLHLDDAVGSKTTALLGRALPRDFIDIAAALSHYTRGALLELAFLRDSGLRQQDPALAANRLDALPDEHFTPYGLTAQGIDGVRTAFASWPRAAADDEEARIAHAATRPPSARVVSAAPPHGGLAPAARPAAARPAPPSTTPPDSGRVQGC